MGFTEPMLTVLTYETNSTFWTTTREFFPILPQISSHLARMRQRTSCRATLWIWTMGFTMHPFDMPNWPILQAVMVKLKKVVIFR